MSRTSSLGFAVEAVLPNERVVVLDTDVWSHLYVPRHSLDTRTVGWRDRLVGATVAIATQTRAEVLAGVYGSPWGDRRKADTVAQLARTPTIPVDERVIEQYARLSASCRQNGHGLAGKIHSADRWVAATALALDVSLITGDSIYVDAPGLRLLA